MTLHRAVLEIDGTINGTSVTGEFNMVGNVTVSEQVAPDYLVNGGGTGARSASAILQRYLTQGPTRRGFHLDLGLGSHVFEFEFQGWEGAVDSNGDDVTWGDPTQPTPSVYNATGADPVTQLQVFNYYLRDIVIDSISPARLYVGEYDSSGLDGFEDQLYVVPMNPRGVHAAEDYSTFDGMYQFVETHNLTNAFDVVERLGI